MQQPLLRPQRPSQRPASTFRRASDVHCEAHRPPHPPAHARMTMIVFNEVRVVVKDREPVSRER